uniref:U2 small nuclear ribonucleoprotein auxiliary factor 35 kDa subunit-related protein 2-like n=1 Tax=Jaculus jaculus TaxID=51337 RepID=UPI001E1AFB57|nr:U2 small nuclear ribonucleoprotein auxiliary factor 35 kDa subunit-related protein 2-like [Jaculus jaculus]
MDTSSSQADRTALPQKMSHRKRRAARKKARRQRRRQELARLRDSRAEEQDDDEEQVSADEQRLQELRRRRSHEEWLRREQEALRGFRARRDEAARRLREEQPRTPREEAAEAEREAAAAAAGHEVAGPEVADAAGRERERGGPWQNPEPPARARAPPRDGAHCPFYSKTGACRFGERCSRKHCSPTSSPTLLLKNMFTTFGMEQCRRDDYEPDAGLEYSEEETYQQFLDFYHDVLPELQLVGRVVQFKVSCNLEPHLRGNVYVQYRSEEECQAAFALLNGRWYAGRRLQCQFCPVTRWKMAICGLFEVGRCPRGPRCNFLHVFRNPNDEFREANRDACQAPDCTGSSFSKTLERRQRRGRHDEYQGRARGRKTRRPRPDVSKRNVSLHLQLGAFCQVSKVSDLGEM